MRKAIRILLMGIVMAAMLSACATPTPTAAPTKVPPTTAPATVEPPTAEPPTAEPTKEMIHIKIGVLNYISHAPMFIARDEGYFAEQGLDVELVDFGSTTTLVIPSLLSGELDISSTAMSVGFFNAVAQGGNLKWVADKGFYDPNNCVTDAFVISAAMAAAGEPTADTIRGKVMVFPPGDTFEYMADTLLASYGLTQADVKPTLVADSPARIEGLKNGSIDISILGEPWISRAKAEAGAVAQWPLSSIAPGVSGAMIAFGPNVLEKNPDVGVRFMVAYLKAIQKFNEGKSDRTVEIISAYTKLEPEKVKNSCWTSFRPDGMIDTAGLMAFQEWGLGKGYINSKVELDQVWTSEFLEQAMAALK
ncbi:MAG: ABC transporter substrate-binding protein [Chloroflexota bacterium]